MTFKEYVTACNELLAQRPGIGDYQCVYSIDDAGNEYKRVFYTPSEGVYDEENGDFNEYSGDFHESKSSNSVCIN